MHTRSAPSFTRRVSLLAIALAAAIAATAHTQSPGAVKAQGTAPPATAAPGSCLQCHGNLLKGATVHGAAEDCSTCHTQEKGGAHRFALAAKGGALCTGCHEVVTAADTFVHGPVAVGDCTGCHNPHSSPEPKLLSSTPTNLCKSCHEEMAALLASRRFTHAPVASNCVGCHSPHASPVKYQLKAAGAALCAGCHDLVGKAAAAPVKHDALKIGAQCLNCHEAHASNLRPSLKAATMPLCLSCHDREVAVPAGGALQNIKAWLASNKQVHGPIREQDCVGCHTPHSSEHFRLLKKDYPPKFYSPFDPANYELCFTCHQPDLVRAAKTTTLTGFRQGDRNLHFLHVNRPDKGRTCRACHEAHASSHPKHLRDAVPFGKWQLPINYEAAADGGRCAPGCHVPQEYRRSAGTASEAMAR